MAEAKRKPAQTQGGGTNKSSLVGDSGAYGEILMDMNWMRFAMRRYLVIILSLVGTVAVLIVFLIVMFVTRPSPKYFASTNDLRFVQLSPLSEPTITDTSLNNWIADTVTRALSLDFEHWQTTLGDLRPDFSNDSFNAFVISLKSSGLLEKVVKQRLVLSAIPESAPVIVNEGLLGGVYSWLVKFPVKVSYEGSSGVLGTQVFKAEVTVQRADIAVHPRGIIIQRIILE
jgi:intracellular multiplication protein IcmL